jgi:uncharacterized protein YbjT (DUF2867 family)
MRIAVLGGTSGFGKWIVERLKELEKQFNKKLFIVIT